MDKKTRKYLAGKATAHADAKRHTPEAQRRIVVAGMNAGDDRDWSRGYIHGLRELGRSSK